MRSRIPHPDCSGPSCWRVSSSVSSLKWPKNRDLTKSARRRFPDPAWRAAVIGNRVTARFRSFQPSKDLKEHLPDVVHHIMQRPTDRAHHARYSVCQPTEKPSFGSCRWSVTAFDFLPESLVTRYRIMPPGLSAFRPPAEF